MKSTTDGDLEHGGLLVGYMVPVDQFIRIVEVLPDTNNLNVSKRCEPALFVRTEEGMKKVINVIIEVEENESEKVVS